jgi:hypothetical protein
MTFEKLEVWVRVLDLPLDMMNKAYGELIGNWIGKYISVEVDDDGTAWGEELRIYVEIRVDKPLIRGVNLRASPEAMEGRWFDIKYEKIPHFCFDCGMLVHSAKECEAEKEEVQQWGEWLRASPGRHKKSSLSSVQRPVVSSDSFSSWSGDRSGSPRARATMRDLPPKRNLFRNNADSGSSRTGEFDPRRADREVNSPNKHHA